jgi:hypothetical protein
MDGLKRGQAVDADLATPGMATQHLMGDYATSATAARTPIRTPAAKQDKVHVEAMAQAHAMRLQTPLLGEASESTMVGVEGGGVGTTPNPLAGFDATPGRSGTTPAATPSRGGVGAAAATPLRDALGINTPGGGTPMAGRRAERARLQGLRDGVRLGLGELPSPHNEYRLTGEGGEGVRGPEDIEVAAEDAADTEARRQRATADAMAHARSVRSAVLRRELPRPALPATDSAVGGSGRSVYATAEALLCAEVSLLHSHDARRYPATGKNAKKRRKKMDALAETGPSQVEKEFEQEELAEAAGMLEAECEVLKTKYGHSAVESSSMVELMAAAYSEHACAPSHLFNSRACFHV